MLHVSKVISSLIGGDLSDRLGRRRLIVSGWILYAAVYAGFAFVTNAISVWVLFLVYGIYFGLAEGAEKALVADLVTGSFIVESIFGIPGIGRNFVQAVGSRDYPLIMGSVLVYAVVIAVANLVVDVLYAVADPRIRYG